MNIILTLKVKSIASFKSHSFFNNFRAVKKNYLL